MMRHSWWGPASHTWQFSSISHQDPSAAHRNIMVGGLLVSLPHSPKEMPG
jgi:hypothetical protein